MTHLRSRRRWAGFAIALLVPIAGQAVIIDRIAIIVENRLVKDSDIERDIRITSYLNGDALSFTDAERKKAASRLIDQQLIRREVELGSYPTATAEEVETFLKGIDQQKPADALSKYGLTTQELQAQVGWQITVLHFIEQRFRPGIMISDQDIDKYARQHPQPREQVEELLTGQRVTDAFESWLNLAHKHLKVDYKEPALVPEQVSQ